MDVLPSLQDIAERLLIRNHLLASIRLARIFRDPNIRGKRYIRVYFNPIREVKDGLIQRVEYKGQTFEYVKLSENSICATSFLTLTRSFQEYLVIAAKIINKEYIFPILKLESDNKFYITYLAVDFYPFYKEKFYDQYSFPNSLEYFRIINLAIEFGF